MSGVKVDIVPLEALHADPKNARVHNDRNIGVITDSIRTVGAARSGVIDEDGRILAGNGMSEGAKAAGLTEAIIVETDGSRPVFVRRRGLSEAEKIRLAIDDNRANELSAFDPEQVARLTAECADIRDHWTDDEWRDFTAPAEVEPKAGQTDPDEVPEERPTRVTRGDLFALGDHRILCGDSTDAADVARLMGGTLARVMNTDPPYGIAYNSADLHRNGSVYEPIENDDLLDGAKLQAFLEQTIRVAVDHLVPECAFYLWHPMLTQGTFFAAAAADILVNRQIIWAKPQFVFGRGEYHWQHELCFYGWRRGHRPPFYGERNQSTLWSIGYAEGRNDRKHPTQKPVDLFVPPIQNHTRPGDALYEPFSGSGSQLIAAEKTGRRCFAMELSPAYVQVAIDRWEAFTGKQAVQVS